MPTPLHMTTSSPSCSCGRRDLLTVKEAVALPILRHVSAPTLYRLIERGEFKARRISERKTLILVTEWCEVHERKVADDIDAWIEDLAS